MKPFLRELLAWLLSLIILAAIIATPVLYSKANNYFFGESMVVDYKRVGPYDVQIGANYKSAIPQGYSIYVYSAEPTRFENGYTVPQNDQWEYVNFASGINGKVTIVVNHTEIVQAVCVRSGTDPKKAFKDDGAKNFDGSQPYSFGFEIDCN